MLEMISQDEDMKISLKCNVAHQLLLKFTKSWIVFEQHCPQYDLNVLVHCISFFEHHCPQLTDSSFNHLSLPFSWSEYCLFSFSGSTVLPQMVNFSTSVENCSRHSCQGFYKFDRGSCCLTIFLVLESNLIFQKSCLFKSNCWNEIKEMSVFESIF
jgi:hypothetical protein